MLCQRKVAHLMSRPYSSLGLVINYICKFVLRDLNIRKKKVIQQFFCNPLKHTSGPLQFIQDFVHTTKVQEHELPSSCDTKN